MLGYSFAKSRVVSLSSTAPECLDLIRSWLASCVENHEDCKRTRSDNEAASPKRLLRIDDSGDSLNVVLVETSDIRQKYLYTALSHCWGSKDGRIPKTTKENVETYKSIGLLEQELSRTF